MLGFRGWLWVREAARVMALPLPRRRNCDKWLTDPEPQFLFPQCEHTCLCHGLVSSKDDLAHEGYCTKTLAQNEHFVTSAVLLPLITIYELEMTQPGNGRAGT